MAGSWIGKGKTFRGNGHSAPLGVGFSMCRCVSTLSEPVLPGADFVEDALLPEALDCRNCESNHFNDCKDRSFMY